MHACAYVHVDVGSVRDAEGADVAVPPKNRHMAPVPASSAPDGPAQPEPKGLAHQVHKTLSELDLRPEDAAIASLAVEYAKTIDRAAVIAAQLARLPVTDDLAEEVRKLRAKVTAHATMADLGPKLQAALDALHATPKARASAGKTPPAKPGKLAALIAEGAS